MISQYHGNKSPIFHHDSYKKLLGKREDVLFGIRFNHL